MRKGLVVIGEILIDFTATGENAQGITVFARNPGGAPANVAVQYAILGGNTALIGKVGRDLFGDYLRSVLKSFNIDDSGLIEDERAKTTVAFVELGNRGERRFCFFRDHSADVMLNKEDLPKNLIENSAILHFGSVSLTDEPSRSATFAAVRAAKEAGAIISFDPNYRDTLWKSEKEAREQILKGISFADILKVSDSEMEFILGINDLSEGSGRLRIMGPQVVFVTCGENGTTFSAACGTGMVPAINVNPVDTTGAGDSFTGALLYCLNGYTPSSIQKIGFSSWIRFTAFANAAGGLTTTKIGAIPALHGKAEIEEKIPEILSYLVQNA